MEEKKVFGKRGVRVSVSAGAQSLGGASARVRHSSRVAGARLAAVRCVLLVAKGAHLFEFSSFFPRRIDGENADSVSKETHEDSTKRSTLIFASRWTSLSAR